MPVTDEALRNGRLIAALVVRHCGSAYLPLFDRIDEELRRREAASDRFERARHLSHTRPPARRLTARRDPNEEEEPVLLQLAWEVLWKIVKPLRADSSRAGAQAIHATDHEENVDGVGG